MNLNVISGKVSEDAKLIASDIIKGMRGAESKIHPLHKVINFKGRKSPEIAKIIIESATKPGDPMLDPFAGSGIFTFEGAILGREVVGVELDNYTYDVLKTLLQEVDYTLLEGLFKKVKNICFDEVMSLYETECCGYKNYMSTLYFDPADNEYFSPQLHREIKDGHNMKLLASCPSCGRSRKKFDQLDMNKLAATDQLDTSAFPKDELIENSRINITKKTNAHLYDTNFVNRSKYALLKIQAAINSLEPSPERDLIEHALVAALTLSRIAQYGSGSEYIYQVMRYKAQEMNVWQLFEGRLERFVKYKTGYLKNIQSSEPLSPTIIHGSFDELLATDEHKEKYSLILTDPPYTDQVPYLERNQLYRLWLNQMYKPGSFELTDEMLEAEMVVTDAVSRREKRSIENYYQDLDSMFHTFHKVLKKYKMAVMILDLGKEKYFQTFSTFINIARAQGFELVFRSDLIKKDRTLRKQAANKNTLSKEMVCGFAKLPEEKRYWFHNGINLELTIMDNTYRLINDSENMVPVDAAVASALAKLNGSNIHLTERVSATKKRILNIIDQYFNIVNDTVLLDVDRIYLTEEDDRTIYYKLYNIVPDIMRKITSNNEVFTLDDLYFEISMQLCNGNPYTINKILSDEEFERGLRKLVLNFCDDYGDYYSRKVIKNEQNEEVIDIAFMDDMVFNTDVLKPLLEFEGYQDVVVKDGAGDRGIDLEGKRNKELHIFQAKRWIGPVGGTPIQRLHSMISQRQHGYVYGECFTTSYFSKDGLREASSTGIKAVDGKKLLERLEKAFPGKFRNSLVE